MKITKPKLAVNEKYEDVLACDGELNKLVAWVMLRNVQAFTWCNGWKKAWTDSWQKTYADGDRLKVSGNGSKEQLKNAGHGKPIVDGKPS